MKIASKLIWQSDEVCELGENPLWDIEASTLYWIDIVNPAIFTWSGGAVVRYPIPKPVASIYLARPGHLLVALRSALVWLDLATGATAPVDGAWPLSADERFNDGRCDCQGVIWISTMDRHLKTDIGSIVRIASSKDHRVFPSHAVLGNGVCFSPDDRFLYFSDTHRRVIHRYNKNALEDGHTLAGELFVRADAGVGKPDGCTVDSDGCLWSVSIGGGCIERYSPEGRLIGILDLPVSHPTHCTFGGPDMQTLLVTNASYSRLSPALAGQPLAGRILGFDVTIQGMSEHRLTKNLENEYAQ